MGPPPGGPPRAPESVCRVPMPIQVTVPARHRARHPHGVAGAAPPVRGSGARVPRGIRREWPLWVEDKAAPGYSAVSAGRGSQAVGAARPIPLSHPARPRPARPQVDRLEQQLRAMERLSEEAAAGPAAPPRPAPQQQHTQHHAAPPPPPSPSRFKTPGGLSHAFSSLGGSTAGPTIVGAATRRAGDDDPPAAAAAAATGGGAAPRPGSPGGVKYRSSIYRSASPSRRVGRDLVVVSNMPRAPRFKDAKTDVPGERAGAAGQRRAARVLQRAASATGGGWAW